MRRETPESIGSDLVKKVKTKRAISGPLMVMSCGAAPGFRENHRHMGVVGREGLEPATVRL